MASERGRTAPPGTRARTLVAGQVPGAHASEGGRVILQWLGLGLLALGAALGFWLFDALSFQDLPSHAGLIAMRDRFAGSTFEQRYYKLDGTIGPYSLFFLLGRYFSVVLGPLGAVRALATLPVIATSAVLLFARRKLHGDRTLTAGFLGIALSFGFMTMMGLASFTLGLAALLLGLTVWLEVLIEADNRQATWPRELVFGALAVLIFLAHGYAFALLLAIVAMTTLSTENRLRCAWRWRSLVPAVILAAWSGKHGGPPPGSLGFADRTPFVHFQGVGDKLSLLITPTLFTRTGIDVVLGLLLWGVIAASFVATVRDLLRTPHDAAASDGLEGRSRAHSRALALAAVGMAAAFLLLPHSIGWFGFIDGRLAPLILFLCILCFRRPALGSGLQTALDRSAPLVACAMTGLEWFAFHHFQAEAAGYREVFAAIPSESRVLNLPIDPQSDLLLAHPFIHYDKLIAIDRPVLLSDVWLTRGSALYPTPANPATRLPPSYDSSDLKFVDWPAYRLQDWDYVLIRTRPGAPAPATPGGISLCKHSGGWWLFQTDRPPETPVSRNR